MFKLILLSIILSACNSNSRRTSSTSLDDNIALVREACPNPERPTFVMGRKEVGCCPPFNGFISPDRDTCADIHDANDPRDNFCDKTPFNGTLIIESSGRWWCCSAGQCGN